MKKTIQKEFKLEATSIISWNKYGQSDRILWIVYDIHCWTGIMHDNPLRCFQQIWSCKQMVLNIRFFYKNAPSCCFSTFSAVEWCCKRVQHFGSTTFGALDTIFEAERWWSYNKSTTVSAEMKIKKERLRNGVTLAESLEIITFRNTSPAGPWRLCHALYFAAFFACR